MVGFDFATAEVIADPYPMFEAARSSSPLKMHYSGVGEMWTVLSYQHVHEVLRDHERFSSAGFGDFGSDLFRLILINDDPPRHTRLRRAVNQMFSRRAIAALRPSVDGTVEALLDGFGSDAGDFMTSVARPLPVRTILSMLGIALGELPRFELWVDNLMRLRSRDLRHRAEGISDMVTYLQTLIETRCVDPLDDVIRPLLLDDPATGGFTEAEVLGYLILMLVAGTESTTYLVGNAVNLLAEKTELWDLLVDQPDLLDPFIDETLRFESPVQLLPRRALVDVELGGKTIPAGALVFVQYGSANRDPNVFAEPSRFRIDRGVGKHVAFGAGIHFCLGSPLAKSEAQSVIKALLRRSQRPRRAGLPVRQTRAAGFFGFDSLPLRFTDLG
jgi:cytochrome P450